jgi:hypothetical protein
VGERDNWQGVFAQRNTALEEFPVDHPKFVFVNYPGTMSETDEERFLGKAEECLR